MSAPTLACGDAVDYPGTGSGAAAARRHAHVIVKIDSSDVYLIPISSEKLNYDPACPIPADCGWARITKNSFAAYYHAKKVPLAGLTANIEHGIVLYLGAIPPGIFQRIIE